VLIGGVAAATVGAVLLALGAQFQGRGVRSVEGPEMGRIRRVLALVTTGGWLLGSGFLVAAVLLQLVALLLAPLPVVQPIGVLSLVVAALLNRRLAHATLQRRGIQGIAICILGTAVFVITAASATSSTPADVPAVVPLLVLLGAVLVGVGVTVLVARKRLPPVAFALLGGVCFGFVVTLMKVVLDRSAAAVQHGGLIGPTFPFSLLVLACTAIAGSVGLTLVQRAYAGGSADLVVAALTVIDPLVAVSLGIGLLGQARSAPLWTFPVFVAAEVVAVLGVALMATHPPRSTDADADAAAEEGSARP
jgi:drug/metabolite transporter (DMT)-like permease